MTETANKGQFRQPVETQHMQKKRKQQAQNFFEKYKNNHDAMMIFMEHLKEDECLPHN